MVQHFQFISYFSIGPHNRYLLNEQTPLSNRRSKGGGGGLFMYEHWCKYRLMELKHNVAHGVMASVCYVLVKVIYLKSALNKERHACFTSRVVSPRCFAIFLPLFSFSTLIGFQESGPSLLSAARQACGPCSLNRGGLGIKAFNSGKLKMPLLNTSCFASLSCWIDWGCIPCKCSHTHTHTHTHHVRKHVLILRAVGGQVKHFQWWMSFSIALISSAGQTEDFFSSHRGFCFI